MGQHHARVCPAPLHCWALCFVWFGARKSAHVPTLYSCVCVCVHVCPWIIYTTRSTKEEEEDDCVCVCGYYIHICKHNHQTPRSEEILSTLILVLLFFLNNPNPFAQLPEQARCRVQCLIGRATTVCRRVKTRSKVCPCVWWRPTKVNKFHNYLVCRSACVKGGRGPGEGAGGEEREIQDWLTQQHPAQAR